jgi:hypothetical protein
MSTQTQTSTTANTETISQKLLDACGVFWVADKKKDDSSVSKENNAVVAEESHHKTFFPLNILGFAAPPLPVLIIPLLIAYYRTISSWDIFFSIAFPLYLGLANRFRFDNNAKLIALRKEQGKPYAAKPEWFEQNDRAWFTHYMLFAATLGVILPIVVQLLAPSSIAQASAPHLYLLVCQIMTEHMVHNPNFHPLLQVINPIGFSAYRMATVTTWAIAAWEMLPAAAAAEQQGSILSSWETMHLLLAGSNALFWFYNTFVMLLLRVLPPCLDQSKFLDANVSWDKHYQIVPLVIRTKEEEAKKSN